MLLVWDPHVRDLAAHVFRAELFEREGFAIWNGSWYGGHYLLTQSVLFPPLGALLGPELVGAISVVAGVYLFDRLARERWGERGPAGHALVRRGRGDDARQRADQLRARRRARAGEPARASDRVVVGGVGRRGSPARSRAR